MESIAVPYNPHPGQILVHSHPARFKVIICGRRFGKSYAGINELIRQALKKPGKYWFVSPFRSQGKENVWNDILKPCLPRAAVRDVLESELKVKFKNGSEIKLVGANNPEALRGSGLCGIILDEYADIDPKIWDHTLRPQLAENKGWAWFIGTPKGHNHFYEEFIKDPEFADPDHRNPNGKMVEIDPNYKSFRFKSADNPVFPGLAEEIEMSRRQMSPEMFRQEYEASFENYTGRIYKELLPTHRRVTPTLKPSWHIYVGIDTGNTTGIVFVAIDSGNKAYVFDEIYDQGSTVSTISEEIKNKLKKWNVADKAIFIIDSASQVKREYAANGIYTIDSVKDVLNSIDHIRSRLKNNQLQFDIDNCLMSWSEHGSYEWDTRREGYTGKPRPIKKNDHTVNALQYVLNSPFVSKPREQVKMTKEAFLLKSILDGDYEQWEDHLGVTRSASGHIQFNEEDERPRNPVTGY